jgi:hypothetical protein
MDKPTRFLLSRLQTEQRKKARRTCFQGYTNEKKIGKISFQIKGERKT